MKGRPDGGGDERDQGGDDRGADASMKGRPDGGGDPEVDKVAAGLD